jgi:hypothetical protein
LLVLVLVLLLVVLFAVGGVMPPTATTPPTNTTHQQHHSNNNNSHTKNKSLLVACIWQYEIGAIANAMDKVMTFSIGDVNLIDSCHWLVSSLNTQAKSLISTTPNDTYER